MRLHSSFAMPRLSKTIFAAALMAGSSEAVAQPHMIGLAGQSCATWTANRPTSGGGLGLLYQQWVFGFFSGASYADPNHDPLNGVDVAAITTWMNNYCEQNATARIADAAVAFVRAHRP